MMAGDWSRLATLIGNGLLFWISLRGFGWLRVQERLTNDAHAGAEALRKKLEAAQKTGEAPGKIPAEWIEAEIVVVQKMAEMVNRPFVDRPALWVVCIAFLLGTIASLIDAVDYGTVCRTTGMFCAPPAAVEPGKLR